MKAFNELMNDRRNSIDLHYIKMHFIGSSGLGKTTTKNRLTGLITNLVSLPMEERKRYSTHLAECTQMLAVMDNDESKLTLKVSGNHDDETRILFAYAYSSKSTQDTPPIPKSLPVSSDHIGAKTDQTAPTIEPDKPIIGAPTVEHPRKIEGSGQDKISLTEVDKVIARLRSTVGSGNYAEQLCNKVLLNLIDIGGQPGFLEMLPFLSKGPGMFLAFFRLDKDLNELCEVSYERGEDKITPYKAIYTSHETLSQILSGIHHHVTFDTAIDLEFLSKMQDFDSMEPVVTLVGTFKDKLEDKIRSQILQEKLSFEFREISENRMKKAIQHALSCSSKKHTCNQPTLKIDTELLSRINQLLAFQSFQEQVEDRLHQELIKKNKELSIITSHFEDLLFYPTEKQSFIALDNFRGSEVDIDPLREHLQKMFDSFFRGAKLRIRPSQLLLGVVLRKEYNIVSMDDCIHIGRALNMGEEEVKFTVWYLDRWVGALIYHPEIDDWFKENIICSPQVVFDSISSLIVETLLELHCPEHSSRGVAFKPAEKKNWMEKGQFSLKTVKRCHSEESKKKVKEGKLIPADKLVKFLEHSNLLSLITTKKKQGRRETEEIMCFIPAILECASPEEKSKSSLPDADTPSPIKITFEPGYVPIGIFCAMISRLVSRGCTREGILGKRWELVESGVKRNLISFRVHDADCIITLVAHVDCYEIRVIRQDGPISLHDLCSYVLSSVLSVMKEINDIITPIIAFDCNCSHLQSPSYSHLCKLLPGGNTCFKCNHSQISLSADQESWFAKV